MSEHAEDHVMPLSTYVGVFLALMVLTVITVWVAYYDLGVLNVFVAVSIACVKTLLVLLYFMHLRYSAHILWLTAAAGFVWFVLLVTFTLSDVLSRGWLPAPEAW